MSDPLKKDEIKFPENVIPLFQEQWPVSAERRMGEPEAFRILTEDIFYLSILFRGLENEIYGHGYAVFRSGEKIRFAIDGNNDGKIRARCIRAGKNIARHFRAKLEYGKITPQGRFIADDRPQGRPHGLAHYCQDFWSKS